MVTVENIMFMVVMLVATVGVGSYGGGEGGRAGRGAVDVDQKLEGMEEVAVEELMA